MSYVAATMAAVSPSQIARRLEVTWLTVFSWLQGTARYEVLPSKKREHGNTIRYSVEEDDLVKWLTKYKPDLASKWNRTLRD